MTKTDSYANYCVTTGETVDNMTTSGIVVEADSQSSDGDQSTTLSSNYSLVEFQCVDSEETFDKSIDLKRTSSFKPLSMAQKILLPAEKERDRSTEITKANLQWRYSPEEPKSVTLAHKLLRQAEKNNKLRSMRGMTIKKSKLKTQKKSPLLQMHYSQAVPSLNHSFIPSWSKQRNYKNSTKVIDSPQPSSEEYLSDEVNGYINGASRKDLFSLQEPQPTTTQNETYEACQSNEEMTTSVDPYSVTESRLAPTESKPTISGNESTDTDRNGDNINSTPVIELQTQIQLVKSTTDNGNGSIEERQTLPPQGLKECYRSNKSMSALWDHAYCKPIEARNAATPEYSPVTFTHPKTNIEQTNTLPLKSPKEFDRASISIPHTTSIASESIELTNIWPPESCNEFDGSNISIPAATQSDVLNESLITVPTLSDYSYNKPIDVKNSATSQFSPAASVIPPVAALSLNQQNFVQTPNAIKPTTSGVKSSAKTQKRPYRRSNKILVQSDELLMPPPSMGSVIRTLPNSADRINSNQIIYDQKPSSLQKNAKPIQMANMKTQVKNEAKSATMATSSKGKNSENMSVHVPTQAKFQLKNEPKASPAATIATSLKRKNKENSPLCVPAKVQKIEKSIQGTMTNIATSSISVNLPDITIERVNTVQEDNKGAVVTRLENRSFSDCVKFLERNNVTVFKVPRNSQLFKGTQNPQPSNKVLDKYMKVLQQNGIRVERVSKNINRG